MSADTWLGAAGMGERQPGVQRHHAGLRPGADQRQQQGHRGDPCGRMAGTHRGEGGAAGRACEQAEAQQQYQAGEARHDDVDVAGRRVAGLAMVRHHQRPGGERHQFPGEQEAERIGGQDDQRHAGQEGGGRTAARGAVRARGGRIPGRTGWRRRCPVRRSPGSTRPAGPAGNVRRSRGCRAAARGSTASRPATAGRSPAGSPRAPGSRHRPRCGRWPVRRRRR